MVAFHGTPSEKKARTWRAWFIGFPIRCRKNSGGRKTPQRRAHRAAADLSGIPPGSCSRTSAPDRSRPVENPSAWPRSPATTPGRGTSRPIAAAWQPVQRSEPTPTGRSHPESSCPAASKRICLRSDPSQSYLGLSGADEIAPGHRTLQNRAITNQKTQPPKASLPPPKRRKNTASGHSSS